MRRMAAPELRARAVGHRRSSIDRRSLAFPRIDRQQPSQLSRYSRHERRVALCLRLESRGRAMAHLRPLCPLGGKRIRAPPRPSRCRARQCQCRREPSNRSSSCAFSRGHHDRRTKRPALSLHHVAAVDRCRCAGDALLHRYELDDGAVEREVCWWGDMALLPHFLNLLAKKTIRATIAFGEPHTGRPAIASNSARLLHRRGTSLARAASLKHENRLVDSVAVPLLSE